MMKFGPKIYSYNGEFNLETIYKEVKHYLEHEKHYLISEKEFDKSDNEKATNLLSQLECTKLHDTEYKFILKIELKMGGSKVGHHKINGSGRIIVNMYLEHDYTHSEKYTPLAKFFKKISGSFLGGDAELEHAIGAIFGDAAQVMEVFKNKIGTKL